VGDGGTVREAEVEEGGGGDAAACSEARDQAAASSKTGDEATTCSRARIEDGRWRQRNSGWGNRRARALGGFKKLLSVARDNTGAEILGTGT
jgi:hypothetical protein